MRRLWILLLAGCSTSPARTAPLAEPAFEEDAAGLVEWHVHVHTEDRPLGAYTIVLRYDASVAVIHDLGPCPGPGFRGKPEYDPGSFTTGETRVTAVDLFPGRPPDDGYRLLTVRLRPVGTGRFRGTARVEKAYGAEDTPIPAVVLQPRFEAAFGKEK